MPRNMSFSLTTDAIRDRTKTVTRRRSWWGLKPGDVLMAVEKGMGLKKGEKVVPLGQIRVVSVTRERLSDITYEDVAREGFPGSAPSAFIALFLRDQSMAYGQLMERARDTEVNRIAFEYVEDPE